MSETLVKGSAMHPRKKPELVIVGDLRECIRKHSPRVIIGSVRKFLRFFKILCPEKNVLGVFSNIQIQDGSQSDLLS